MPDPDLVADPNIVNAKKLADQFGVTQRWIAELSTKEINGRPVVQKASRGKFDYDASVSGYIAFLKEESTTGNAAARRKLMAQAQSAEIDLAIKQGDVVHIDDVLDTVRIIVSNTRTALLGCPTEIATEIDDGMKRAEIKSIVEHHITEALRELSKAPKKFVRKPSRDKKAG